MLDRGFTEPRKVAAFSRARASIAAIDEAEFDRLRSEGRLTSLSGVGSSSERIIHEWLEDPPGAYLSHLELTTKVNAGAGAELRAQLKGDLHTHTDWSDGGATLEQMWHAAAAIGHEYLVITDHSPRLTIAHGLTPQRLVAQEAAIDALQRSAGGDMPRLLRGSEVDILEDGSLDLPDDVLARLDVVVASVHSELRMDAEAMTARLIAAVRHPSVDVLGHITGRKITGRGRPPSTFDSAAVFRACAESATAVEINCRPERMDPPDELLVEARDAGCTFAIDSDAHAPGQLEWLIIGCDRAARFEIPADRIINTRSAEDLVAPSV